MACYPHMLQELETRSGQLANRCRAYTMKVSGHGRTCTEGALITQGPSKSLCATSASLQAHCRRALHINRPANVVQQLKVTCMTECCGCRRPEQGADQQFQGDVGRARSRPRQRAQARVPRRAQQPQWSATGEAPANSGRGRVSIVASAHCRHAAGRTPAWL